MPKMYAKVFYCPDAATFFEVKIPMGATISNYVKNKPCPYCGTFHGTK